MPTAITPQAVRSTMVRANVAFALVITLIVAIIGLAGLHFATMRTLRVQIASLETQLIASRKQAVANHRDIGQTQSEIARVHRDAVSRIEKIVVGNFEDVIIPSLRIKSLQVLDADGRPRIVSEIRGSDAMFSVLDDSGVVASRLGYMRGRGIIATKGDAIIMARAGLASLKMANAQGQTVSGMMHHTPTGHTSIETFSSGGEPQSFLGVANGQPYLQLYYNKKAIVSFTRDSRGFASTQMLNSPQSNIWGAFGNIATVAFYAQRVGLIK